MTAHPFADLIAVADRLGSVLRREIEMLQEMRPGQIATLQDEKTALIDSYAAQIGALNDSPGALDRLDAAAKLQLRRTVEGLRDTMTENEMALRAAHDVNVRLVETVVEAVNEATGPTPVYDPSGRMNGDGQSRGRSGVALTVDTEL